MSEPANEDRPLQPKPESNPETANPQSDTKKLTPEEQMALYEKELKETDWGHQPC